MLTRILTGWGTATLSLWLAAQRPALSVAGTGNFVQWLLS